jgi:hypothetical protein
MKGKILNRLKIHNYGFNLVLLGVLMHTSHCFADKQFVKEARLPTDVQKSCEVNIESWFIAGSITENGWVSPANSLNPIFADSKNNSRCDFYKWGAQMFLWLTSNVGDQHVFNTAPSFYNLSLESNHEREFIAQSGPMMLTVRKGKTDEEIELGQAGNSDALLSQDLGLVYYGVHANDVYALFTTQQQLKILPACKEKLKQCLSAGSEKPEECKQQFNSCKIAAIPNIEFPNTQDQLNEVSKFASTYGYPLSWDKKALALELKTSWVDAKTLKDASRYVLTQAIVPVFDRSVKSGPWTVSANQEKTLALVGMHVVGTVNRHPEMVWSTFEHVDNVPDNAYIYNLNTTGTNTQGFNSKAKKWTFLPEGGTLPSTIIANASVQTASGSTSVEQINCVKATSDPTKCADSNAIGATNVMRVDPFGNLHGSPAGSTAVDNNTDLVSINVSVLSQLSAGDTRGNYIQTGGIWTVDGQIPSSGSDSNLRGSLNLANTTMETFYQFPTSGFNPINCFGCHNSSSTDATGISHVFDNLQPLPKK